MENEKLIQAVIKETLRIEEDALHSMKGHFNAANRWSKVHLILGIPSAVLAGWAGIEAFSNNPEFTAILALLSAAITSTITFLNPEKIAENHNNAGRQYSKLKNSVRKFREIDIFLLESDGVHQNLDKFFDKRNELNSMSPNIPRWAYDKAKKDINNGAANYQIDLVTNNDNK